MVLGTSLPQYYSCGRPMYLGYVTFVEEFTSSDEAMCQIMDSKYEEVH
jgi:hypothetical protein